MKTYRGYYFAIALLGALLVGSFFTYASQYYSVLNDASVTDSYGCWDGPPKYEKWCPSTNLCQGPDKPCPEDGNGGDNPGGGGGYTCPAGSHPGCVGVSAGSTINYKGVICQCTKLSNNNCSCYVKPTPTQAPVTPTIDDTPNKPTGQPTPLPVCKPGTVRYANTCGCSGKPGFIVGKICLPSGQWGGNSCFPDADRCPQVTPTPTPTPVQNNNYTALFSQYKVACGDQKCAEGKVCAVNSVNGKKSCVSEKSNNLDFTEDGSPVFTNYDSTMRFPVSNKPFPDLGEAGNACKGHYSYSELVEADGCIGGDLVLNCTSTASGAKETLYCRLKDTSGEFIPIITLVGKGQLCNMGRIVEYTPETNVLGHVGCREGSCIHVPGSDIDGYYTGICQ